MKKERIVEDILGRSWKLPKSDKAAEAIGTFSPTEKAVFFGFVAIFILSAISLLWKVNNSFLVTVPERGGTLQEGIIGSPRFVNPLLALSDADRDLVTLVYSGLMRATPEGMLVPDLAKEYSVSPDGLVYTFVIRDDATFHDGTKVTARDVEFTVAKAKEPGLKSPRRVNWEGVTTEVASESEIHFILKEPYAPFLENTTLGILPRHIWENITSEEFPFSNFNVEPIGSGPYKVKGLKRDSGGIPVYYHLKPFDDYVFGSPYIANIIVKFYDNQKDLIEAYEDGSIESMHGLSPAQAEAVTGSRIATAALPRVFGVFFNQSQATVLTHTEVRRALDLALDKERIVREVLRGFGTAIDSPVPAESSLAPAPATTTVRSTEAAQALLEEKGWERNAEGIYEKTGSKGTETIRFTISTSNAPELKRTAELVADDWKRMGADVDIEVFELGDLNQDVIRSRTYDALLFGQVVGRNHDLYPFWHSSQRNDPGLNVAQYANITADKLLEEARASADEETKNEKHRQFLAELEKDAPAVFLYSPKFIYAMPNKVQGAGFGQVSFPSDRFLYVNSWYIETNKVWSVFTNKQ